MNNALKNIVLYLQRNFIYFLNTIREKEKQSFLTKFEIISPDFLLS